MAANVISLTGKFAHLKPEDARRLAVYVVRGSEILAQAAVPPDGVVRVNLARHALTKKSAYPLEAVVGPANLPSLEGAPRLQRVPIRMEHVEKAEAELQISLEKVDLSDEVLKAWWLWCPLYCVNGTVITPDGCPVPGAQVTVYSVAHAFGGGFTKTPRATVTTDANGKFTACFNWCTCRFCWPCWPCWPIWWLCWPWWWEWDILHVIENLEKTIPPVVVGPGPVDFEPFRLALSQPAARDLMVGQGFASARKAEARFVQDPARTALIQRKLANPQLRAIFPWWWWCCDDPNIVFTVTQGPNLIVNEDPASQTRWCFEDGSTVTLVGNDKALGACPGGPKPAQGFVWTRVGNITVNHIHDGYADGTAGTDSSDMAFASTLDIYGEFAAASGVAYYQVDAGQWTGDPARGGTAPGSSSPISAQLWNSVVILHTDLTVTFADVLMGPFNSGGVTNLYATQEQRPSVPGGLLPPFPTVNPGDAVLWSFNGRKVYADGSALIGGSLGGVTLTITGYNNAFAAVALPANPDDALTLEVDGTGLTAQINSLKAFRSDGTPVTSVGTTGACPAYDIGPGGYVTLNVTVQDANGHLFEYEIEPDFGSGSTGTTTPGLRGYRQPGPYPVAPYQAPNVGLKSFGGGTEDISFYPTVDCCYDFRLLVGKRVTNGQFFPSLWTATFQTATLKVSS